MKRAKIHYGDRFDVSLWIPPATMTAIAEERTEGMVGYFVSTRSRIDPVKFIDELGKLARSCYMQGLNDAIDAAAKLHVQQMKESK